MEKQPNYLPKLIEIGSRLGPGLHDIVVEHDDSCAFWKGRPCDCRPNVRPVVRVKMPDGRLMRN